MSRSDERCFKFVWRRLTWRKGYEDGDGNEEVGEEEDEAVEEGDYRESPSDDPDLKAQEDALEGLALIPEEP